LTACGHGALFLYIPLDELKGIRDKVYLFSCFCGLLGASAYLQFNHNIMTFNSKKIKKSMFQMALQNKHFS
jgi:hypothetical protein